MNKDEQVRQKAYQLWVEEGRPHGRDQEHWHRAHAMIGGADQAAPKPGNAGSEKSAKAAPTKAAPAMKTSKPGAGPKGRSGKP